MKHYFCVNVLKHQKKYANYKQQVVYDVISPLYSCKSEANCMNVRRAVVSKAVNPDLVIPKFGLVKIAKFVGITYIVENS